MLALSIGFLTHLSLAPDSKSDPKPLTPACSKPFDSFPFCNTSLSVDQRIEDLLKRIPDETKPNLLTARGGPHGLQIYSEIGLRLVRDPLE